MTTTPLFEFMKARIAEDEAVARAGAWQDYGWEARGDGVWETMSFGADCIARCEEPEEAAHIARHDPARVLAECAAKLRIVQYAEALWFEEGRDATTAERYRSLLWTVQTLAAVYSGHPAYEEALGFARRA